MSRHLSRLVVCFLAATCLIDLIQPLPSAYGQTVRRGEVKPKKVRQAIGLARVFRGHRASVLAVAYSPDGSHLASLGDFTHIVRVWDVKTGKEVKQLTGKDIGCVQVLFSPDGGKLLSRSFQSVILWDLESGKQVGLLNSKLFGGMGFLVPQGAVAVAGTDVRRPPGPLPVFVKQLSTEKVLSTLNWNSKKMPRLTFSQNGAVALAIQHRMVPVATKPGFQRAVADPIVRLMDLKSGKELLRLEGPVSGHLRAAIAPDNSQALLAGDGGQLWLFDLKTGKELRRFQGHTGAVKTVTFSPDGRRALSGSDDKTMRMWDVESGKQLELFRALGMTTVSCIAFSPDGKQAVSGSYDRDVRLWQLPK